MLSLRNLLSKMVIRPQPTLLPRVSLISTQLVRQLSVSPVVERGSMKKKWTMRRNRHNRITRVRARTASRSALHMTNKFRAQVARRQAMVNTVWEHYGLTEEPGHITEMERRELTQRYINDGVFNEVLSPVELRNYQFARPFMNTMRGLQYMPRQYRNSETHPYKGVNTFIPLERMRDPKTGKLYKSQDIRKYQTGRHENEKAQIKKKGFYAHERAINDSGYLSLRNTKEYDSIGQIMRLDNWIAKVPKQDPRFRSDRRYFGKRNMYFGHKGYYDRDFQMPWRFYHLHANHTIAEHRLTHPSPFSKYTAPRGWNRVGHFHSAQLQREQLKTRFYICSVFGKFQRGQWKQGRVRRTMEQIKQLQKDRETNTK